MDPLNPPPKRPVLLGIERTGLPMNEEEKEKPPAGYEGIELTVYGLKRDNPQSAARHLEKLLGAVKAATTPSPARELIFRSLTVRQADVRHAMDYAYISINPEVIPQPRPDLLQSLRTALEEQEPGIRAAWRTQQGPDKTRRITFAADSKRHADEIAPKLDEWLSHHKFPTLIRYISQPNGTHRITYDLIEPEHVEAIYTSPPVIDGRTYYPTRPRFIARAYGFEIAVLGCRDWQSAKPTLDSFIRKFCRRDDGEDPIAHSRLELDGDVYAAVMNDWESTMKVAESRDALQDYLQNDPCGRYLNTVPQPGLLYGLNTSGLFLRQGGGAERSSSELRQLRNEIDAVRAAGTEGLRTIFAANQQTNRAIASLADRLESTVSGMSSLVNMQHISTQISRLDRSITELRQERNHCQLMLLQPNIPDDVHQENLQRIRRYEADILKKQERLGRLEDHQEAISFGLTTSMERIGAPAPGTAEAAPSGSFAPPGLPPLTGTPSSVGSQLPNPTGSLHGNDADSMEDQQ